ncbi:hypothetical protein [Dulcicalothrix desertica]|uniref:hypothetical protein n=1 Tax=Dulcicalothrix desertica TaxID=32056 RepID=UPI00119BEA67|nr:hypothetical protein [Dulcicalothrix desertica]TWH55355.1 hypothetical protein CAL7102_03481 [Dulcicalothrix desertica PCC 7102]
MTKNVDALKHRRPLKLVLLPISHQPGFMPSDQGRSILPITSISISLEANKFTMVPEP